MEKQGLAVGPAWAAVLGLLWSGEEDQGISMPGLGSEMG